MKHDPVAIVGLGCRFPGAADPEAFWQLIRNGIDAITEVPAERWNADAFWDPYAGSRGKMNTRWGGFLKDVDLFDTSFFGISRGEAANLDPQQRLLLEVTWEAIENAGLPPHRVAGSRTGVFVGIGTGDYGWMCLGNPDDINAYSLTGNLASLASNRVSHFFDFRGPSLSLDTACSSSLLAVHLACQSLRAGECAMAIAGGVNLMLLPNPTIAMSQSWIMSPEGRCKSFDNDADGYVRGEGCGIVVLKKLSDALADGDRIRAVIRGSAANQDGRGEGLTVPSSRMQQAAIEQALSAAGIGPDDVDYVEAHGIGSALTDGAEIRALHGAFVEGQTSRPRFLGSVKTNIGHLECASGIAALIKTTLCIEHGEICPNLHLKQLTPEFAAIAPSFSVPVRLQIWPVFGGPRMAGVNAFGIGGTNVHVVVEEAPSLPAGSGMDLPIHILTLSARTPAALRELAARYVRYFDVERPSGLHAICFTANSGRTHFRHRLAIVAEDPAELRQRLAEFATGNLDGNVWSGEVSAPKTATVTPPSDVEQWRPLLEQIAGRYVTDADIDWSDFVSAFPAQRLCLPTYPFERTSHWVSTVHRAKLVAESGALAVGGTPGRTPAVDELVQHVRAEVADLLGVPAKEVDVSRGLFDSGLTSLMTIELHNRLRRRLGTAFSLPPSALFEFPTIEILAASLVPGIDSHSEPYVRRNGAAAPNEPIAIVGMSCRFPGADDPEMFWQLLSAGTDAIREVPPERWKLDDYYDPNPDAAGKMYTRSAGFLDDVGRFDAAFFGIAPREAVSMDPQQRLVLETAWQSLEMAGCSPAGLARSKTGVFIGIGHNDYSALYAESVEPGRLDAYATTGTMVSAIAGRIAYALGLQGPAMSIDTACSSSLTAVHLACQSLRAGECDLALAGGVNLIVSPEPTVALCQAKALSPDGRCKTFDAGANGYARGEGCGLIVLKRLSDTTPADRVIATIKGSAVNHDGASSGFTVPNGLAQQAVIREALQNASLLPHQISLVEAHGTGTPLGDPIETRALVQVLREGRTPDQQLFIGSVKTNIGHLESAAGIAGLIKVALSLQHREIPPHLHLRELNPDISWGGVSVTVPQRLTAWPAIEGERYAGISSFGLSGTNAHVILGEHQPSAAEVSEAPDRPLQLLTISAKSEKALNELVRRYRAHLGSPRADRLSDVAWTANTGRSHFSHRIAVVAGTSEEAALKLSDAHGTQLETGRRPKIAFLFSGQGSQYPGMARQLYETHSGFRATLDRSSLLLEPELDRALLDVIYNDSSGAIDQTEYTQPALFAIEWALVNMFRDWGIVPTAVLGHSLGEYAAACAAGVMDWETGLKLVARRGRLMQRFSSRGAMAAIFAPYQEVSGFMDPYAERLSVAAINGPAHVVVSGEPEAISELTAKLKASGKRVESLTVSRAFHSALMDPALDAFEREFAGIALRPPSVTMISNVSGSEATADMVTTALYWRRQARETVLFQAGIQKLVADGIDVFVEIGPTPVLCGMGRQSVDEGSAVWLPALRKGRPDWTQALETAAELYTKGVDVDWAGFDRDRDRRIVALPVYPFQGQRHWFDTTSRRRKHPSLAGTDGHSFQQPAFGRRIRSASKDIQFEMEISASFHAVSDHRVYGTVVVPAAFYIAMVLAAYEDLLQSQAAALEDLTFPEPLVLPEGESRVLQLVLTPLAGEGHRFQLFTALPGREVGTDDWTMHASGTVHVLSEEFGLKSVEKTGAEFAISYASELMPAGEYYRQIADIGIQLGPAFRWIEHIWSQEGRALGKMRNPANPAETSSYRLHPGLIDSCFQVVASLLPAGKGEESVWIPIGIDGFRVYGRAEHPVWCHGEILNGRRASGETITTGFRVFDERKRILAVVENLHLKRAPRESLMRADLSGHSDSLCQVEWVAQNLGPIESVPALKRWLVCADQDPSLGALLLDAMTERGLECSAATGVADISDTYPLTDGVLYLAGTDRGKSMFRTAGELEMVYSAVCAPLLRQVQALTASVTSKWPRLWIVTRSSLAGSAAWGLGRAVALEHPEFWGGLIDLDAESTSDEATQIIDQISGSDGEGQVRFRSGAWQVARLVPLEKPALFSARLQLRPDATFLVTGGLGALGRHACRWLAGHGARNLVLVNRHAVSKSDQAFVDEMTSGGASVRCAQADIADYDRMAALFGELAQTMPPLRGIVHSAGVFDDHLVDNLSWEQFAAVMRPKANGAWNLHLLTEDLPLDFFILFSSVASIFGSPGQANYATANAFMDNLSHFRRSAGRTALSINWGPWADGGMATSASLDVMRRRAFQGWENLSPEQGLAILDTLVRADVAQAAAFRVDWQKLAENLPLSVPPKLFAGLMEHSRRAAEPDAAREDLLRRLEQAPAADRKNVIVVCVRQQVARVLGIADSESIDVRQPLNEMGLDSLMALELTRTLGAVAAKKLPPTLLFNYPTVDTLAGHLFREAFSAPLEESVVIEDKQDDEALEKLSDEDVEALLEQELASLDEIL